MGRTIKIPLGDLSGDRIEELIRLSMLAILEKVRFGDDARVKIARRSEELEEGTGSRLGQVHHKFRVRKGWTHGLDVVFYWDYLSAPEMLVEIKSNSALLEWCFRAILAGAIALVLVFTIQKRVLSDLPAIYSYILAYLGICASYIFLRLSMAVKGRSLLDSVESVVRKEMGG